MNKYIYIAQFHGISINGWRICMNLFMSAWLRWNAESLWNDKEEKNDKVRKGLANWYDVFLSALSHILASLYRYRERRPYLFEVHTVGASWDITNFQNFNWSAHADATDATWHLAQPSDWLVWALEARRAQFDSFWCDFRPQGLFPLLPYAPACLFDPQWSLVEAISAARVHVCSIVQFITLVGDAMPQQRKKDILLLDCLGYLFCLL